MFATLDVPETKITIGNLVIAKDGLTVDGETITDAGEIYAALTRALNGGIPVVPDLGGAAVRGEAVVDAVGAPVIFQARSPEGDPWVEVSTADYRKARANGFETRIISAASPVVVSEPAGFKNFHRSLCARFGYTHDEQFWWRDLVSLEEFIAGKVSARAADAPSEPSDQTAVLKVLSRLLDGSQPTDVPGAVTVIDSTLGGKQAWEYTITPPVTFSEYVAKNYSGDVNFHDPEWHAKRLWNAAMRSVTGKSRAADALESHASASPVAASMNHARSERDGWTAAAKALGERAAGHFRAENYELQDECLQCASMLYDMRPADQQAIKPSVGNNGGVA